MEKIILNTSSLTAKYTLPDQAEKTYSTKSNPSKTENMSVLFVKDKSSMFEYGSPNDEIQQNIILSNESESEITEIRLVETIGNGAHFKPGSVTIEDVPYENMDITNQITLPNSLPPNTSALVSYILVIDEQPNVDSVALKTNVTFNVNEIQDMSEDTPEVTIAITENKLTIQKTSERAALSGSTLVYTNVITNTGKYKNTNIVFTDQIPVGTTFVNGSVKINNQDQPTFNPADGFALDDMEIGTQTTITFSVKVD